MNEEGQELLDEIIEGLYPPDNQPEPTMCFVCPILPKDMLERLRDLYDQGQISTFFAELEKRLN